MRAINRFLYRKAALVIVPGRDMKERLAKAYFLPSDKIAVVENWTDPDIVSPVKREENEFLRSQGLSEKFVVMYSGNIGLSQDLENLVAVADELRELEEIVFVLVGEGALKESLVSLALNRNLKNIRFFSYQEKENLKYSLSAAHIHLIPLKRGMKGIIVPSKVYGIMAAAKPFIAAVDEGSEIDRLAKEFECGLVVTPSDVEALKRAILWAFQNQEQLDRMGRLGREVFEKHYSRSICTHKFRRTLESLFNLREKNQDS
jgi:glycosyltransferase involved in cell wall biosynthesis